MALKDLEKELYGMGDEGSEKPKPKASSEFFEKKQAPTEWQKEEKENSLSEPERPPLNFYQPRKKSKWLYFAAGILLIGLLVEGFFLAKNFFSRESGIAVSFDLPEKILAADPFDLRIDYRNDSSNLLQNSVLVLELPKGVRPVGEKTEDAFLRRDLGNLGTNSRGVQVFRLAAVGESNAAVKFKASLQYNIPGFSSRFSKEKTVDISISGTALAFGISLPKDTVINEEFSWEINYSNNSQKRLSKVRLQAFYPLGFNFISSDPAPIEGNGVWDLGDLDPNASGKIVLKGRVAGRSGSYYEFGANFVLVLENQQVDLGKQTAVLSVKAAPLQLLAFANNSQDYIFHPGENANFRIDYKNDTDASLEEAIIQVSLTGEMIDYSSIKTDGYYDSGTRKIIWNAGNHSNLRLVGKGESGSLNFSAKIKSDYPIKNISDKNFNVGLIIKLESLSKVAAAQQKTEASSEASFKVSGKTELNNYALFRDAASGIVNKGSLPLKVGKATNFTIHWKIKNYSDDLTNVEIKTVLGSGVSWTGLVSGNYGDFAPIFNERTGEVIWRLPKVAAGTGIVLPTREAIFQISLIPSSNQIGQNAKLMDKVYFSGKDEYTGKSIDFTIAELSSSLEEDKTVKKTDGIVNP